MTARAATLLAALWLIGCPGGDTEAPAAPAPPATAEERCRRLEACSPFCLRQVYGTVERCEARERLRSATAVAAPSATPTCLDALLGPACPRPAGAPATQGQGCPQPVVCDPLEGTWCHPGESVCKTIVLARVGEPCGLLGSDLVRCDEGGSCDTVPSTPQGVCVPAAQDGAPCDPVCQEPARCEAGRCAVP